MIQFAHRIGLILTVIVALLVSESAFARRMDHRQRRQSNRIRAGVKSGELTRREARHLTNEQKKIHRVERRAKSDGEVTGQEKARIEKMQDNASSHIQDQKHDDQGTP